MEETRVSRENHRPTWRKSLKNYQLMLYRVHLAWEGFELTTLVVIGTDYIGSYRSNYHTITTTMAINVKWFNVYRKHRITPQKLNKMCKKNTRWNQPNRTIKRNRQHWIQEKGQRHMTYIKTKRKQTHTHTHRKLKKINNMEPTKITIKCIYIFRRPNLYNIMILYSKWRLF